MNTVVPFQYIGLSIEAATNGFLVDGVANIIDSISPLILLCVTIQIMGNAYLQIMGRCDDLVIDTVKNSLIILCITTLTLNVDHYTYYIVGGITALGEGFAESVIGNSDGKTIYQTLDKMLEEGISQAAFAYEKASMWRASTWLWIFSALTILIAIGMLTLTSGLIIIGTKFFLVILFVLGPLFITAACFPVTRRYFDAWMSEIVKNCLVQIFGVSIIFLGIEMIDNFMKINNLTDEELNPLSISVQVLIGTGILSFVIKQIPSIAASLAGGFASASMTMRDVMNPSQKTAEYGARFLNGPQIGAAQSQKETWKEQQSNKISKPDNDLAQCVKDQMELHSYRNQQNK